MLYGYSPSSPASYHEFAVQRHAQILADLLIWTTRSSTLIGTTLGILFVVNMMIAVFEIASLGFNPFVDLMRNLELSFAYEKMCIFKELNRYTQKNVYLLHF